MPPNHTALPPRVRQVESLLQQANPQHPLHAPPAVALAQLLWSVNPLRARMSGLASGGPVLRVIFSDARQNNRLAVGELCYKGEAAAHGLHGLSQRGDHEVGRAAQVIVTITTTSRVLSFARIALFIACGLVSS